MTAQIRVRDLDLSALEKAAQATAVVQMAGNEKLVSSVESQKRAP